MPGLPSSFDPQNPRSPAWICTCRKCGSNGKVLPKRTWYNHNPGGKAALYDATTERGREGIKRLYALHRPAYEAQDQRLYGEVEGVEDPSRASKRVATSSSSVRRDTTCIPPGSENEIRPPSPTPTQGDVPTPVVVLSHTPGYQDASNAASSSKIPQNPTPARGSLEAVMKKTPRSKKIVVSKEPYFEDWKRGHDEETPDVEPKYQC